MCFGGYRALLYASTHFPCQKIFLNLLADTPTQTPGFTWSKLLERLHFAKWGRTHHFAMPHPLQPQTVLATH